MFSPKRTLCLAVSVFAVAAAVPAAFAATASAGTFNGDPLSVSLYIGGAAQGVPEGTVLGVDVVITNPDLHRPMLKNVVTLTDNNEAGANSITATLGRISGGSNAEVIFGHVPLCVAGTYSITVVLKSNGGRMATQSLNGPC